MVKSRFLAAIGLALALAQPVAAAAAVPTLQERVEARRSARQSVEMPQEPRVAPPARRRAASTQASTLDRRRARIAQAVVDATNAKRAEAGLPALTWNGLLEQSAKLHAEDMKNRAYFAHESPDGVTSGERILASGYGKLTAETCECNSYRVTVGENLAHGQQSVEKVIRDWMNSEGHRDNMLQPLYKEIGIGIAGRYWVQHFGGVEKD